MSFKLWLCGGRLLEVPCSRISHVFRRHNEWRKKPGVDFVAHNFKRIAEVWLDEYKEYLYKGDPQRYARVDAGDLTREKLIRKNLNCKPFQYYLEFVAPDMLERYPYTDRGVFAKGAIQSEANETFCVDTLNRPSGESLGLYKCHQPLTNPGSTQDFILSWHRQIKRNNIYDDCIDTYKTSIWGCHFSFGHQYWFYNLVSYIIIFNLLEPKNTFKFSENSPTSQSTR